MKPVGVLLVPLVLSCLPSVIPSLAQRVVLKTRNGWLAGTREIHRYDLLEDAVTDKTDTFLGIRYANPPVGELRFKPPIPPEPWDGMRNATHHGWVCPQLDIFHPGTSTHYQREDCLYLDVYTPYSAKRPDTRYPVMVFIHGGSYEVGSGKLYNGQVLALFGVVVVSINYRLGALGFLTSGDDELKGNYGMWDQVQALRWVSENIAAFRGDPSRVTIFGHSAGGSSVGLLLTVPAAKGLFHRVIAQSGSAIASYSFHERKPAFAQYIRQVGALMDCPGPAVVDIVSCLRTQPYTMFIDRRHRFPMFDPIDPEFRPIVDGDMLPETPRTLLTTGRFSHVPIIMGTVKDEFGNYFNGGVRHKPAFDYALDRYVNKFTGNRSILTDVVKYEYTDWWSHHAPTGDAIYDRGALLSDMHMIAPTVDQAGLVSQHGVPTYQYHFTTGYSYHSVELNYVFGAPFSGRYADEMNANSPKGAKNFTKSEKHHSRLMMTLWSNFAKYGSPTKPDNPWDPIEWTTFSNVTRDYVHLGAHESLMKQNLRADKVAFWNILIPRLKNATLFQPVVGDSYARDYQTKMWAFLGIAGSLLLGLVILLFLFIRQRTEQITRQSRYGVRYMENGNAPAML